MKERGERRSTSGVTAGDVQGIGIVIGHGSSASVKLRQSSEHRDAAAKLDEFIRLLEVHRSSVADVAGVRESAAAVQAELAKPSPKWQVVRGLLRGIAAGVAGVSALAEAISNIQALVSHLT